MLTSNRPLLSRVSTLAMASLVGFGALVAHAPLASAFEQGEVSPDAKGIIGGALLGAEAVTIVEALAGTKPAWAYAVGGILGAGGGAVGGYFVERQSDTGRAPVYMLAGGIALIIPAVVLSLNATRYRPSDAGSEDFAPTNGPTANPGMPSGSMVIGGQAPATSASPATTPGAGGGSENPSPASAPAGAGTTAPAVPAPATPPAGGGAPELPLSLLHLQGGDMRLGLPVPEVRAVYSTAELKQYGVAQQTELRVPLVRVLF